MNNEKQILPELRFPEFEGEWNEKILENLCFKISDGIHSTPKYDNTGDYYFVNGNNLINGIIVINESTKRVSKKEFEKHKRELGNNTILLSINGTIGSLSEYNNEKVVLGKSACYINVDEDKVYKKFILFSLKTEGIRNYFYSELTGSTIKNLSLKTIKNTVIKLPKPKEQQKIADCLSSLDEVITAATEKLDLLKDHKKGLLQQLFPAEGETKPQYRFPEFVNDGDWEVKKLQDICDVNPSNKELPEEFIYVDLESVQKGRLLKRSLINIKDAPSRAQRLLKKEDVIYQMVRPYQKNNFFFDIDDEYEYVASTGYALLRAFKSKMFLYQYLHTTNFVNRILAKCTGSNYPAINSKDLSRIKVIVPKILKEQQKIAKCLSSLDDLIENQTQKIKALKKHKKGLMQQLFPNVNSAAI